MKAVILIAIFCVFPIFCIAQDPVMFDQMGDPNCETFFARVQNLFQRLREKPADRAFVVIKGPNSLLMKKLRYEMWLQGVAEQEKFDLSRVSSIRTEEDGSSVIIEFWVEPIDADFRSGREGIWNLALKPRSKALEIYSQMEQICTSAGMDRILKELLDANPRATIEVRVFAPSKKRFDHITNEVRKHLKGLPEMRIRSSWFRSSGNYAEYWVVPPQK